MDALARASTATDAPATVAAAIASLRPLVRRIDEEGFYPAEVMRSPASRPSAVCENSPLLAR